MEQPEKMNQTSKKKTNNRNRNRHRKTNSKPTAGDNIEITTDNADTNISSSISNFPKDDKKPELPITPAKDQVIASPATEEKIIQEVLVKKIAEESAKPNTIVSAVNVSKPVLKMDVKTEKSREEIMAEREAKKAAKLAAKNKSKGGTANTTAPVDQKQSSNKVASTKKPDIKVETVSKENKVKVEATTIATAEPKTTTASPKTKIEKSPSTETELSEKMEKLKLTESDKQKQKPATTKAERRAQQEAQRASKAKQMTDKQQSVESKTKSSKTEQDKKVPQVTQKQQKEKHTNDEESEKPIRTVKAQSKHRVKLFNHLYTEKFSFNENIDLTNIHPSIIKLGLQYANGIVVGSNARCMAFLNAMITVIKDFKAPVQQEYKRGLEIQIKPSLEFLHKCRPLSVSIINSLKYIKSHISQLNTKSSDEDQRDFLLDLIDTYIRDQIEKAAQAISISVQEKISNDDVILTYGCSSLIKHILEEANRRKVNFRVIVVDSRPKHEGQEMLRRLVSQGIDCTCVLINAIGFIMPEVTKVLLGAHALLANGYVTSRVGTAQIALVAKSYNVPVLVCCETHKFSERVQTDAFVYNELGDPNDLILNSGTLENRNKNHLAEWSSIPNLTPLNLYYDITPPELVTAVVTEVAILPCTSVPVILRIKPSEIGY